MSFSFAWGLVIGFVAGELVTFLLIEAFVNRYLDGLEERQDLTGSQAKPGRQYLDEEDELMREIEAWRRSHGEDGS